MRRFFVLLSVLLILFSLPFVSQGRPLIQVAPKASLYLIDATEFGIGADIIVNPAPEFGFRINPVLLTFDNTALNLNYGLSTYNTYIDGLYYFDGKLPLHAYGGFGLYLYEVAGETESMYVLRGGAGIDYEINKDFDAFGEAGLSIAGNGGTNIVLEISGGVKFGLIK